MCQRIRTDSCLEGSGRARQELVKHTAPSDEHECGDEGWARKGPERPPGRAPGAEVHRSPLNPADRVERTALVAAMVLATARPRARE